MYGRCGSITHNDEKTIKKKWNKCKGGQRIWKKEAHHTDWKEEEQETYFARYRKQASKHRKTGNALLFLLLYFGDVKRSSEGRFYRDRAIAAPHLSQFHLTKKRKNETPVCCHKRLKVEMPC